MKIVLLHLSDLHFKSKGNFRALHLRAIVSAMQQSIQDVEHVIVVVTGDLTFAGKSSHARQVSTFLDALRKEIIRRFKIKDVQFAIVPGNHDNDYDVNNLKRSELEAIEKDGNYDTYIRQEIKKQSQFYNIGKEFDCFPKVELLHKKVISYGDKKIQFNLINTAVFSSLEEDQGFHYLPKSVIEQLLQQGDSDFVITVMHHPHHWYTERCRKKLESALYSCSDIIFVGHEHYETTMKIESCDTTVNIFAGGKLCDRGNWNGSEFHVAVLGLEGRNYLTRKYIWDNDGELYKEIDRREFVLSKDRFNPMGMLVNPEFVRKLNEDNYLISKSSQDYFVFPLLMEKTISDDKGKLPLEVDTMASLLKVLEEQKKVVVYGSRDTGKSILARAVFKEIGTTKVSLFLKGKEVIHNFERTIHNAFMDIFTQERFAYEAFKQLEPNRRAIVIDDFDSVDPAFKEKFAEYLDKNFGTVFKTCQPELEIDIISRLKRRLIGKDYLFLTIEPFYSNKRQELVSNVIRLILKDTTDVQNHVITLVCDVLTKQKYLYDLKPAFIVEFTRYYCKNIGDNRQSDSTVFSKVFEAKIVELLQSFAKGISVDKLFTLLDKIAYGIYVDKSYPINPSDLNAIIDDYNREYGSKINSVKLINLLKEARIISETDSGYSFYDRNHLAYFTAREIRRRCVDDNDFEQFNRVLKYSYMWINADILLFLTYIADNTNIIKKILEKGIEIIHGWSEFDFNNIDIPLLAEPIEAILKPVEENEREQEEKRRISREKEIIHNNYTSNDGSIFDGENEVLTFLQEVMRGISFMSVIARILPAFEHMMKLEEKRRCVSLIYQMPLKIFKTWALKIDEYSFELINEIKKFHEGEYQKRNLNKQPLDDKEALKLLRLEIFSVLLDLMNVAMLHATRNNTNDFIDDFPFLEKPAYGVEHLMGLEYRDNATAFFGEAERLFEKEQWLTKFLVSLISRHYIVNSKTMTYAERQKLNISIFKLDQTSQKPFRKSFQSRLFLEQNRKKDKK